MEISGNLWKLILSIHISGIKSFWDTNLSFFPLFWGYKLHFQPINVQKFNLKKNYNNFEKKNESPHGRFNPCAQNENSFHQNFTKP